MNKKIVIYIIIIIVLIIGGIFTAKKISEKGSNVPVSTNTTGKNESKPENEVNNVNEVNEVNETNEVTNETTENNTNTTKPDNTNANQAPEEKAKELVKLNWGEDDSVYYSYDGKDENGNYIICVRKKDTTKALYWYYVDIETGTLEIK